MKKLLIYISIIIAVIIQISVLPNFPIYRAFPNLIFIFLLIYLIRGQDDITLWWVILGGLLLDLFSPFFFGYFFIQLLLIFFIYRFLVRPLLHEPSYPIVVAIFFAFTIISTGFESFITRQNPFPSLLAIIIYQSTLGFILYFSLSKLTKNLKRIKA